MRRLGDGREWKDNPAWLAKAIAENIARLQDEIPTQWMPRISDAEPLGEEVLVSFREYGCGAYGCVLPTYDDELVLKVTTDETEAEFVGLAMPWGWPDGITKYFGIMELSGRFKVHKKFEAMRAWALWRESASHVGGLKEPLPFEGESDEGYAARTQPAIFTILNLLKSVGDRIYVTLMEAKKPAQLLAAAVDRRGQTLEAFDDMDLDT